MAKLERQNKQCQTADGFAQLLALGLLDAQKRNKELVGSLTPSLG
jgi:hypothetical protein